MVTIIIAVKRCDDFIDAGLQILEKKDIINNTAVAAFCEAIYDFCLPCRVVACAWSIARTCNLSIHAACWEANADRPLCLFEGKTAAFQSPIKTVKGTPSASPVGTCKFAACNLGQRAYTLPQPCSSSQCGGCTVIPNA